MNILSLYLKGGVYATSKNTSSLEDVDPVSSYLYNRLVLPVIAIPRSIITKLEYKKLDYKEIISKLPIYNNYYSDVQEMMGEVKVNEKSLPKSLTAYIGIEDAISVFALTSKLLSYEDNTNASIYRLIDFTLSENDYKNEVIKISNHLSSRVSNGLYSKPFDIESDNNGFYIIMNDNSFTDYDSMYKELSRELCVRMLQSIDESFVYRSVFFKAL